jgi:hypothetical protein
MKGPYGNPDVVLSEIGGRFVQGRDRIVPPQKIALVCRLFWPVKTAVVIGDFAKQTDRTAKRWLSGELDFPAELFRVVYNELHKRE